jgi:hypothetical protein
MKKKIYVIIASLLFGYITQAQSLYGGIEIGDKEIKMSVLNVQNLKKGSYDLKDSWTENIEIAAGIPIECMFTEKDIENVAYIVLRNYRKMQATYNIANRNIYIVASPEAGMVDNADILAKKILALTKKKIDLISFSLERELLLKGSIPPKNYLNSMMLNIGNLNTKGGYISEAATKNTSASLSLDIGIFTLTQKINKTIKQNPLYEFNETMFNYLPTLRQDFSKMYTSSPTTLFRKKDNIYLSGDAVWAFYILINNKTAQDNFSEIKYTDIVSLKFVVENNFNKIRTSAVTNKDVKKVLERYSQKNLISASNLLLTALEEIQNINNKNMYFSKNGEIAWLISYALESSI